MSEVTCFPKLYDMTLLRNFTHVVVNLSRSVKMRLQGTCGQGRPRSPCTSTVQSGTSCSNRRQLNELVKGNFVNCVSGFNITKTRLFKYIESFTTKIIENFQIKILIFLYFCSNIDCGYSLEPPRRGGSNEYPQPMF